MDNHLDGSVFGAILLNSPFFVGFRAKKIPGFKKGRVCPVDSMVGKLNKVQLHLFSSRRMDKNQYISAVHEMDLNAPFASFLCMCVCELNPAENFCG